LVPEQCARRRCAETDERRGLDESQLGFHPGPTGDDLRLPRRLVDTPFAPQDELEVLHGIGDVERVAIQTGFTQRAVEHLTGGGGGWPGTAILLNAGVATAVTHQEVAG